MKKYFFLCIAILLFVGCNSNVTEYPQEVEFNVIGTDGVEFFCYYGDTLGNGNNVEGIIPVSYYIDLVRETSMVVGHFHKKDPYEFDTLIVEIYVDEEFVKADTTTDHNSIMIFYPDYPE